jgi:hypothetical protein
MEVIGTSEMSVPTIATRFPILQDGILQEEAFSQQLCGMIRVTGQTPQLQELEMEVINFVNSGPSIIPWD